MKHEVKGDVPVDMKPYWDAEALSTWHCMDWWRPKFERELDHLKIWELRSFHEAWNSWLGTDNPYAINDREMIRKDDGRYMNLIGITGSLKE